MSAFRFPPPPPPPPQQSSSTSHAPHTQIQRGQQYLPGGSRGGFNSHGAGGRGGHQNHRGMGGGYRGRGAQHYSNTRGPSTGDKRKWSDRSEHKQMPQGMHGGPVQHGKPQTSVAPAVPNFGFSLPQPMSSKPASTNLDSSADTKDKTRRKTNQLGLTPKGAEREDSDDEVDEEAAFAISQMVSSGTLPNMNNRVEVAAWIAERKKRYPTRVRLEEQRKVQQQAELDRLKQKVQASREANKAKFAQTEGAASEVKLKQRAKLEKHLRKAEKLRQHLASEESKDLDVTMSQSAVPKMTLISSAYDSDDTEDQADTDLSDSDSSDLSSSGSDSDLDSTSVDSSDDEAPEESSSKQALPSQRIPVERKPKEKEVIPEHLVIWVKRGFCKDYLQQKPCRYGRRCNYKHTIPQEVKNARVPRVKLFDRLAAQEAKNESLAAVYAIQALGATGFFKDLV